MHAPHDGNTRNLAVAIGLAEAGIRVFPAKVEPDASGNWRKQPLVSGWQAQASDDREQLVRWWRQWPRAVPGIPLEKTELIVIDADRHAGGADGVAALARLAENNGGLPAGPVTETAGGGLHFVFRQPRPKVLGNRRGDLPAGIDVRGKGGWIVAPGSIRPDGKMWTPQPNSARLPQSFMAGTVPVLPDWLVRLIEAKPDFSRFTTADVERARGEAYARAALQALAVELATTPQGRRNEILNQTAFRVGGMVARGWIDHHEATDELYQAGLTCGLPPDEVQKTFGSGFGAGLKNPAKDPEDRQQRAGRKREHSKPNERKAVGLKSRKGSTVKLERITWVWQGRIAKGKHTAIAGEPAVGKSTMLYGIAATITKGAAWPAGEGTAPKGSVVLLSAEDGPADTILPRFLAAGGDPEKLHIVTAVELEEDGSRSFNLQADLKALEEKILEIGDVVCCIIDPISSYMGSADSHKNAEVRSVVEPLNDMADRLGVAIVSNSHFSKSGSSNNSRALHRIIGSVAFVALPRIAFAVVDDGETDEEGNLKSPGRKLFLHVKNNIAPAAQGLAYRLEQILAGYDDGEPPEPVYASTVKWESDPVQKTADQAISEHEGSLRGDKSKRASPARDKAEEFIRELFKGCDSITAKELNEAAREAGITAKPFQEAREKLCESYVDRGENDGVIKAWMVRLKKGPQP